MSDQDQQEAIKVVTDHVHQALSRLVGSETTPDMVEEIKSTMTNMLTAMLAKLRESDAYQSELLDPVREILTEALGVSWGFGSAFKLEQLLKSASDPVLEFVRDRWESSSVPFLDMELAFRAGAILEWKVTGQDDTGSITTEFVPKHPISMLSGTYAVDTKG